MFTRRGKLEIIYDILSLCTGPTGKTYIMYQANLSYSQLQKYLEYLLQINLLQTDNAGETELYIITNKGINLIQHYKKLIELLTLR